MPNVYVQLWGHYDMGYTVMVSPWQVSVSKGKKEAITWKSSHPFKIEHETQGNFSAPRGSGTYKKIHRSGQVKGESRVKPYHYSILIQADPRHIVTIDPDYRIEK